jgi:hypothetical protein
MSTENTPVESVNDDLDAFSAELFGQSKTDAEPASSSEQEEVEDDDSDATETETQTNEDDTLETEDAEDETEDEASDDEAKPEVKKPKNRFQERIDELNSKFREEERQRKALEDKIAKLESSTPKETKTEPTPVAEGPSVDEKNEDGTDKYPLGEFDPNYIRDLTKFTLRQEREAIKIEEEKAQQQKKYEAERDALREGWNEKLGPAQERYPDFQDKGAELFDTFAGIDQSYGEYLTATLMSMDYGPDVLYYLASNLDEANKIVASGPTKATIALGRLESKFAGADEEKQKARPKVSKAPPPPAALKGSSAVVDVPDDTDDLDAFSKKLFKKK